MPPTPNHPETLAPLPTLRVALACLALSCQSVLPAAFAPGFAANDVVTNLPNPTAMAFAPDGRLFVCQQDGALRVIRDGQLLPGPFLKVDVDSTGERGLLGVAFDPGFTSNRHVYVHYTAVAPAVHNRVSRFTAAGDVAAPGSEQVLVELDPLTSTSHNGGAIHFGPDRALYIAVGENTVATNSQSLGNRLGKILRLCPDGSIPEDNPYYAQAQGPNRAIWAMGLRNPFTFAFDPVTGLMLINDVGADAIEEINEGLPGANYGWPECEGACASPESGLQDPVFQYNHDLGQAITGGVFYRPATQQFPASYQGRYFFADVMAGWIRCLDPATGEVTIFANGLVTPVDLKVSPDGMLYYLSREKGANVHRIVYIDGEPPLETSRSGQSLILSWPTAFSSYRLESALTPGGPGWTPTTEPVVERNGLFEVSTPVNGAARFFRLIKP